MRNCAVLYIYKSIYPTTIINNVVIPKKRIAFPVCAAFPQ